MERSGFYILVLSHVVQYDRIMECAYIQDRKGDPHVVQWVDTDEPWYGWEDYQGGVDLLDLDRPPRTWLFA